MGEVRGAHERDVQTKFFAYRRYLRILSGEDHPGKAFGSESAFSGVRE
jgi:hypothetical protein